jgi:hypothetical protein
MDRLAVVVTVIAAGCVPLVAACASMARTSAIVRTGHYDEPHGRYSCDFEPGRRVRESYSEALDRGLAEFFDDFGMTGIYFARGSASALATRSGDRATELAAAEALFVLPNVLSPRGPEGAQVSNEQLVSVGGDEALAALVEIPGASGAFDVSTGKRLSATVGTLIFIRGDYVFAITNQNNMWDADPKSDAELAAYTKGLIELYESCAFPES